LHGIGGELGFWADQNVPDGGTDSAGTGGVISTASNIAVRLFADAVGNDGADIALFWACKLRIIANAIPAETTRVFIIRYLSGFFQVQGRF